MLWIHPTLQALATALGLWVLYLGFCRFKYTHLKIKTFFNWKGHVRYGQLVLILWLIGLGLGMWTAKSQWGIINVTGAHFIVATIMGPLAVFGFITGWVLDKRRKRRFWLPVLHGVCNTVLVGLALYQVWSGWGVIKLFLLH